MRVGLSYGFQNTYEGVRDYDVYQRGLEIMCRSEDLGFELVWSTEHHFNQRYAMTPDNLMILTHFAAKMPSIQVGTGAVILPWNNPLRVAERILLLDHLTNGRVIFGMGRGLAKKEYDGFMTDMSESRERYDVAARMILRALETGVLEGDGPYYPQTPTELHPGPIRSFRDRVYAVGMSPASVVAAADLGAGLMMFIQQHAEEMQPMLQAYRDRYREVHGIEPPLPPVLGGQIYCHPDPEVARERARQHISVHYLDIVDHYDMADDHFADTKGYAAYAESARRLQEVGKETAALASPTPSSTARPTRSSRRSTGCGTSSGRSLNPGPMGGMPFEVTEASIELVARDVLPELKKLQAPVPQG